MPKVTLRNFKVSDAKRLYKIINNSSFKHLSIITPSIEIEKEWIKQEKDRRKKGICKNFGILYGDILVGSIGVKFSMRRKYLGELGYFIEEAYWGRGIATKAVRLIEKEVFKKMGISRIEIIMKPENKASERVAIKCGYKKEGLLKKIGKGIDGKMKDCWLYAKTK